MKHTLNFCTLIAIALLSSLIVRSQTVNDSPQHYESDRLTFRQRLAFDYPRGWEISVGGTPGLQSVTLTQTKRAAQIVVNVQEGPTELGIPPVRQGVTTKTGRPTQTEMLAAWRTADRSPCDFEQGRKVIADILTQKIAGEIHTITPLATSPVTTQLAGSEVAGEQFRGVVADKQVIADVYSTRLNHLFVSLAQVRGDDDEQTRAAWNMVLTTLKVSPGGVLTAGGTGASGSMPAIISGGVLNGKAISLPRPGYPPIAAAAHASGTVVVQVVIDETGAIVAAHAVSGHPLLQDASLKAARAAKFSPTKLCGEPVKVTGVITYNFVAQ